MNAVGTAFTQQTLYLMLMYAWRMWPGGHTAPASSAILDSPIDLLAHLLSDSINRAYAGGLKREYVSVQEETLLPSGRLLMTETIKNRVQRRPQIYVERDSFSADCPSNRILLATARKLARFKLDRDINTTLSGAMEKLASVSDISPDVRQIYSELHKSRRVEYRIGISIALTMAQATMPDPGEAGLLSSHVSGLGDEQWFRTLFESFLREFYRHHLSAQYIGGRQYMWGESNEAVFPVMRTDINIETKDSILVIDAKCTPKVAAERQDYGKLTLSSGHLYQLFTYMHHCGEANPEKKVRGALVYPLYKIDVDSIVETSAGSLRVKTVDFKQEWEKVRQDLLELAFG